MEASEIRCPKGFDQFCQTPLNIVLLKDLQLFLSSMLSAIQSEGPIIQHCVIILFIHMVSLVKYRGGLPLLSLVHCEIMLLLLPPPASSYIAAAPYRCLLALAGQRGDLHALNDSAGSICSWNAPPMFFAHPSWEYFTTTIMRQHSRTSGGSTYYRKCKLTSQLNCL